MGKGVCIKRMVTVINYNANSVMEKKKKGGGGGGGGGGGVQDMLFPEIKQKT